MHGELQFFLPSFVNSMGKNYQICYLREKEKRFVPLESVPAKSW
jgi:hypothetical protein